MREVGVLDEGFLHLLLIGYFFVRSIDEDDFGEGGEFVEQFFEENPAKDGLLPEDSDHFVLVLGRYGK